MATFKLNLSDKPVPVGDEFVKILANKLLSSYSGQNRVVEPHNVYQEAVIDGQREFEDAVLELMLPGSGLDNIQHLQSMCELHKQGKQLLMLFEHRGNFDVPSFSGLLRRLGTEYDNFRQNMVYLAGRKLNESSDIVNLFTEKYSRLALVPRRELMASTETETRSDLELKAEAARINRSAFRYFRGLRQNGKIFVLYPLGGRMRADRSATPIPEVCSYIKLFDYMCLVSMEGNLLEPKAVMEDERPNRDKVVFRFSEPLECSSFLSNQESIYDAAGGEDGLGKERKQFVADQVLLLLEDLRLNNNIALDRNYILANKKN